ncbi:hypothetical protein UPYG_G00229440 [Umbra pygmaea]|uniref:Vestigial n=1 Tax=Umbra pygmaea TaxID=75934 RepID=A0ABD0WES9_UMBPY
MSCLDVMYPAYGHYAQYATATPAFINSFQAPIALRSPSPHCRNLTMESTGTTRAPEATIRTGPSSSSSSCSSSSYPSARRPEGSPKEKLEVPEAEYPTSRCVLFTYYQGDISSVVDEHFSRALSSYIEAEGRRRPPNMATGEGWGYAQGQAYGPPRALHELYSPSGLDPHHHYGTLLMPTMRPPHLGTLPGHHPYEVNKLDPTTPWPALLPSGEMALNMDAGLQHHKKGKELYWF